MTTNHIATLFKRGSAGLGRVLALALGLALCVPVMLLPQATAVPAAIWILLAVVALALLVLQFSLKPAWKGITLSIVGVLVVSLAAVAASQYFARTPPILDAQGQPLPGSIAVLEKVTLNGSEQWISIRGQDVHRPVLLFLAGGPGGSQLATARFALGGLEQHFVVVNNDLGAANEGAGEIAASLQTLLQSPQEIPNMPFLPLTNGLQAMHAQVQYLDFKTGQVVRFLTQQPSGSFTPDLTQLDALKRSLEIK